MAGRNLFGKCIFCEYAGRSDHLNSHIATMHPGATLLASPPEKFRCCPGKPNMLVMVDKYKRHGEEERDAYRWGYCYSCCKLIKSKKTTILEFEGHCCKPKQTRVRKVVEEGKVAYVNKSSIAVSTVKSIMKEFGIKHELDDVNYDFCLKESLKSHLRALKKSDALPVSTESIIKRFKNQKSFKNPKYKDVLKCFEDKEKEYRDTKHADFIELCDSDDDEEETFDECDDCIFPMLIDYCQRTNKTAHQHDILEEQRIAMIQKDSEIDDMKEEIARLKKIVEHQSFR